MRNVVEMTTRALGGRKGSKYVTVPVEDTENLFGETRKKRTDAAMWKTLIADRCPYLIGTIVGCCIGIMVVTIFVVANSAALFGTETSATTENRTTTP